MCFHHQIFAERHSFNSPGDSASKAGRRKENVWDIENDLLENIFM